MTDVQNSQNQLEIRGQIKADQNEAQKTASDEVKMTRPGQSPQIIRRPLFRT